MLRVSNLSKSYGSRLAVAGLSFEVGRGEVLGLLGPNGAGKSTTMKIITGFLAPSGGSVHVGGVDMSAQPIAAKRQMGYLAEGAPAYQEMTTFGFLRFVAAARGLRGAHADRAVRRIVEMIHLEQVLHQAIDTLSKGFRRRVGLAQALIHDAPILILDEPTDGLDPNQKFEVRALIREMAPEKAIVLSTHLLEEVDALCTRALIVAAGRIVADGTPLALRARSRWHNAVTMIVEGEGAGEGVQAQLHAQFGPGRVEIQPASLEAAHEAVSALAVTVFTAPDERGDGLSPQHVAEALQSLGREQSWRMLGLYVDPGRLDDVFRDLTLQAQERT